MPGPLTLPVRYGRRQPPLGVPLRAYSPRGTLARWSCTPGAASTLLDTIGGAHATSASAVPVPVSIAVPTGWASAPAGASTWSLASNGLLALSQGTVWCWIQTTSPGASFRGLVVKEDAYGLFLVDGVVSYYDWSVNQSGSSGVNVADGKVHLLALVFRSGVVGGTSIYIDGAVRYVGGMTVLDQTRYLTIASGGPVSGGQYYTGSIADCGVGGATLTPAEVRQLYLAPFGRF